MRTGNAHALSLGAGWMVVASAMFALMGVCVKSGAATFSPVALVFWRTSLGVVSVGAAALWRRDAFATPWMRYHMQRGLIGFVSLLLSFYAMAHLPLSTAVTLTYTSPIFLAALSVVLLGETLSRRGVTGILLGFAGVLLLLRPTFAADAWPASLAGLLSGALAGWSYLHVRELGRRGEAEWRVVFYFALLSSVGSAVIMACGFAPWRTPDLASLPVLAGVGATATLGQLAMTRAYKVGNKLLAANLAYLTVVFAALLGWGLWDDALDAGKVMSMTLIVISGIFASRR
ncbi:DMT family transporter [Paludibacterium paludis]|uniref:Membrane protein n=1 Tax=Paludibacterium paludis TaxID=1225769 RepID=A0A918P662_9NEIS|nr:DMT family transporter [Paludibacterium paludis]GGY26406.1 membrane protein [Paludibacterium paludis]